MPTEENEKNVKSTTTAKFTSPTYMLDVCTPHECVRLSQPKTVRGTCGVLRKACSFADPHLWQYSDLAVQDHHRKSVESQSKPITTPFGLLTS